MANALYDLSAKNIQDTILISDPHISFFKRLYKKYTDFSKYDYDINFTNDINFGESTEINIPKMGDLIKNIIIVLDLPKLSIPDNNIYIADVSNLIDFNFNKNIDELFTNSDYNLFKQYVNDKIYSIKDKVNKLNEIYEIIKNNNYKTYYDLLNDIIFIDNYDIEYKFLLAYNKDFPKENISIDPNIMFINIIEKYDIEYHEENFTDELKKLEIYNVYKYDPHNVKQNMLNIVQVKQNIYECMYKKIIIDGKNYTKIEIDVSKCYNKSVHELVNKFYIKGTSKKIYENINYQINKIVNSIDNPNIFKILKKIPKYEIGSFDHTLFFVKDNKVYTVFEYIEFITGITYDFDNKKKLNDYIKYVRNTMNEFYNKILFYFGEKEFDYFNYPHFKTLNIINNNLNIEYDNMYNLLNNNIDDKIDNDKNNIEIEYLKLLNVKSKYNKKSELKKLHTYIWDNDIKIKKKIDVYNINDLINKTMFRNLYTIKDIKNYIECKIDRQYEKINNLTKELNILTNIFNNNYYFSWIDNIGHNIISKIDIFIGDDLITSYTNDIMNAEKSLNISKQQSRGYNIIIGNTNSLVKKNTKIPACQLYIPLQEFSSTPIPIINLSHDNLKIKINFNDFNNVVKTNYKFINIPKLNGKLIGEYIYISTIERNKLFVEERDMIVNSIKNNYKKQLVYNDIIDNEIIIELQINDFVENIVWFFKYDNNYVFKYQNKMCDNIDVLSIMDGCEILFDEMIRQEYMDYGYYNYVMPYKMGNCIPVMGIYSYNFNISNNMLSGYVNTNKIDKIYLKIKFNNNFVKLLKKNNNILTFNCYTKCLNVLRTAHGYGGLFIT